MFYSQACKWILLSSIFALTFFYCSSLPAEEQPPEGAEEFALQQAIRMLNLVPISRLEERRILFRDESATDASLGKPFKRYVLLNSELKNCDNNNLKSMLKLKGWAFPVIVNGELRTAIHIKKRADGWHKTNFGGGKDRLEKSIYRARRKWPEESDYSHSLLTYGSVSAIMVEKGDEVDLFMFDDYLKCTFDLTIEEDGSFSLVDEARFIEVMRKYEGYCNEE